MDFPRLVFACVWLAAALGCSAPAPDDPCLRAAPNVPAFEISISSSVGRTLANVAITVDSGGYPEVYDWKTACPPKSLVCFVATRGDLCAVDSGGEVPDAGSALTCDLWADGNADLTIEAEGYAKADVALLLEKDSCGHTKTKSVSVELVEPE